MIAWGGPDLDRVLSLMHDDCVFASSVGPEPGLTLEGKSELRSNLLAIMQDEQDGEHSIGPFYSAGDMVVGEWSFEKKNGKGEMHKIKGVDLIHVQEGKIKRIDAYRKAHDSSNL